MKNWIGKLGGRKFVIALFSLVAVAVGSLTGMDLEQFKDPFMFIVGPYLVAQGFADGMSKGATATVKTDNTDMPDFRVR